MSNAGWFVGIVGVLVAASFTYLFKLFELADGVRRTLLEAKLWSPSSFPEGIAHIERHPSWSKCVRGYYAEIQSIYHLVAINVVLLISILLACVIVVETAVTLDGIILRQGVTALSFAQVGTVMFTAVVLFFIVKRVNERSIFKGEIEAIALTF